MNVSGGQVGRKETLLTTTVEITFNSMKRCLTKSPIGTISRSVSRLRFAELDARERDLDVLLLLYPDGEELSTGVNAPRRMLVIGDDGTMTGERWNGESKGEGVVDGGRGAETGKSSSDPSDASLKSPSESDKREDASVIDEDTEAVTGSPSRDSDMSSSSSSVRSSRCDSSPVLIAITRASSSIAANPPVNRPTES